MSQRPRRGLTAWLITTETPIFVLDERQVVVVFNQGCERLTQWTAAEVIGKPCTRLPQANPQLVESVTSVLRPPLAAASAAIRIRSQILRRDGTTVDRDIHFFQLAAGFEREQQHVLGVITPPEDALHVPHPTPLDLRRHLASVFQKYRVDRIVARSSQMQRVAAQLEIARQTKASVHILGEAGTGKEHLARLIHQAHAAPTQLFVPLRCGSGTHFELNRVLSRLAELNEPEWPTTIYLDRVDLLPGDLQPRLATLMERGGSRWISSSVSGLDALPEERFQPELRSRLTLLSIAVPPLRERSADLLLLAQQLLEETNMPGGRQVEGFTPAAERALLQYTWPGNVDELQRVLHCAAESRTSPVVDVGDLPYEFLAGQQGQSVRPVAGATKLEDQLARFEAELIADALSRARGNKSLAAEQLGIPRAKLYRRMAALGLIDPEASPDPEDGAIGEE